MWSQAIITIRWQGNFQQGPMLWSKTGSFFWAQLLVIKPFFDWSTLWVIGDGHSIAYWYDKWGQDTLASTGARCQQHRLSLREAASSQQQRLGNPHEIQFTDQPDKLEWNWTAEASYNARSIYNLLVTGGRIKSKFAAIWKYKIPPKVRIFLFLLLHVKLLTREVMMRRQFHCQPSCEMCTDHLETALHLFFQCSHAQRIWEKIGQIMGTSFLRWEDSVQQIWYQSQRRHRNSAISRTRWPIVFSATVWMIWKQRNLRIFEGKIIQVDLVMEWIIQEATLWEKHCWVHVDWIVTVFLLC